MTNEFKTSTSEEMTEFLGRIENEDVRFFHDKFQRQPDVKTATQLVLAVEARLKIMLGTTNEE